MRSENIGDLTTALAKAQGAMTAAVFNRTNPHFKSKYADLASVIDAVREPLSANGLAYTHAIEIRPGGLVLLTTLHHKDQWVSCEYPLPTGAKPQEFGSALTYAKRYSLSMLCGIAADDDDDANAAQGQPASAPAAKPTKRQTEPPVNPETGEVGPHQITAADAMAWGGLMVAAVATAKDASEVYEWVTRNQSGLDSLAAASPKARQRVQDRINEKLASFEPQTEAAE